jgi:hypothetical protein
MLIALAKSSQEPFARHTDLPCTAISRMLWKALSLLENRNSQRLPEETNKD